MKVKGADKVAKASERIVQRDRSTWVSVYYDCESKTVMTEAGYKRLKNKEWAWELTKLIRPCTAEEVESATIQALNM